MPTPQSLKTYTVTFALAPRQTGRLDNKLTIADINQGAIKKTYTLDIDESALTREGSKDNICTHLKETGVCKHERCYIGCFPAGCSLAEKVYGGEASQSYWSQHNGIIQDGKMGGAKLFYIQEVSGFVEDVTKPGIDGFVKDVKK
jgi:hypothetical protein